MTWRIVRQVGEQLRERRREGVVDDDDLAAAVGRDVDQLLGEQPDVEGVEYRAHRRDGEVGGQVLGVVPHERGDALVTGDAEAAEGVRQLGGLGAEIGEAEPAATVGGPRHDLLVGVEGGPVAQELRDQQRCCLHGALHAGERVKQCALSVGSRAEPSQTCNAAGATDPGGGLRSEHAPTPAPTPAPSPGRCRHRRTPRCGYRSRLRRRAGGDGILRPEPQAGPGLAGDADREHRAVPGLGSRSPGRWPG